MTPTDREQITRALRYVDQLEAHMDEGRLTAPNNVRDLIQMAREVAALLSSAPDAWKEGAEAGRQACIAHIKRHRDRANYCERLGSMDPETGAVECSLEVRGGDCLCVDRMEEDDRIIAKLEALPLPTREENR